MSTKRQCKVQLVNNYGAPVNVLEFQHKNGIDDWTVNPGKIEHGKAWGPRKMDFETGVGSAVDHWYVKFTDDVGVTYDNDIGFDCSPEEEDQNQIISVKIEGKLHVEMSDGDYCEESWRKV